MPEAFLPARTACPAPEPVSPELQHEMAKAYRKALRAAEMAAWEDPFQAARRRENRGES